MKHLVISLLFLFSSCAVFVTKHEKFKAKPISNELETLYIAYQVNTLSEGKLMNETELLEHSEMQKRFELITKKKVQFISRKTSQQQPNLIIIANKTLMSFKEKALFYSWAGVSAVTFGIVPVWLEQKVDLEVISRGKNFKVNRTYTHIYGSLLLPAIFFKHPRMVIPKMQTDVIEEIVYKAF